MSDENSRRMAQRLYQIEQENADLRAELKRLREESEENKRRLREEAALHNQQPRHSDDDEPVAGTA